MEINVRDIVGGGYGEFWRWRGRYRVVKGSRGSKKSKTAALWYVVHMMMPENRDANLLVVRKVARTLKDSCWADLMWAARRLGVEKYWKFRKNPLEAEYIVTGQRVLFRGLDDPQKLSSLSVDTGLLTWAWIEEAYEIEDERAFEHLDEGLRGESLVFKQVTLTLNPWDERHWIKSRFFDPVESGGGTPRGGVYGEIGCWTTTYMVNEYLEESDREIFEAMRERNPKRYRVAALGEWGLAEGAVYENWELVEDEAEWKEKGIEVYGLDFGYTNDPTALFCGKADLDTMTLWVFDEWYAYGAPNSAVRDELRRRGLDRTRIYADHEMRTIDWLNSEGILGVDPVRKPGVAESIATMQDWKIKIHPRCENFRREIGSYIWDVNKAGKVVNKPSETCDDHLMDAMRYAMVNVGMGPVFSWE